jgi:hypothetical protein
MDVKKWDELFHRFANRLDAQRQRQEQERELTAWYDEQTKLVMMLVREVAHERAGIFERATGQRVEVAWPSRPPINVGPEGPFMSFMSISRAEREVHLYSHRVHTGAPAIHFVVSGDRKAVSDRKRVVSHAGCRIERRVGGGFVLLEAGDAAARRELSADDIAFRGFELLLAGE